MSYVWALRGGSGATGYGAYTDNNNAQIYDTVSWPGGNYNRDGVRVCVIEGVSINGNGGVVSATVGSDGYVRVYGGTPRLNVNRNPSAGGVITEAATGYTWAGGMTGSFTWSTVAGQLAAISATRTGRNVLVAISNETDDGGQTVTSRTVQRRSSADGVTWGAWGDDQAITGGSYTYTGLSPALFHQFRAYANNSRGSGQARESASVFVPAGGKRWNGSSMVATTIARRWNGSAFVDLTIAKRWNGTSWVDLS